MSVDERVLKNTFEDVTAVTCTEGEGGRLCEIYSGSDHIGTVEPEFFDEGDDLIVRQQSTDYEIRAPMGGMPSRFSSEDGPKGVTCEFKEHPRTGERFLDCE